MFLETRVGPRAGEIEFYDLPVALRALASGTAVHPPVAPGTEIETSAPAAAPKNQSKSSRRAS